MYRFVIGVPSDTQYATRRHDKNRGDVFVPVLIAIAERAAIHDHRVIEQRAVAILRDFSLSR